MLLGSSFTRFYWFLLVFTGFYGVLLGFTVFYWVLLSFTEITLVLLGFDGFLLLFAIETVHSLAPTGLAEMIVARTPANPVISATTLSHSSAPCLVADSVWCVCVCVRVCPRFGAVHQMETGRFFSSTHTRTCQVCVCVCVLIFMIPFRHGGRCRAQLERLPNHRRIGPCVSLESVGFVAPCRGGDLGCQP